MILQFRRDSLAVGVICLGLVGCDHSRRQEVRPATKPPEDLTSWSAPALSKGGEAADSSKGFSESESLRGSLSKRGADIERSLGVVR